MFARNEVLLEFHQAITLKIYFKIVNGIRSIYTQNRSPKELGEEELGNT